MDPISVATALSAVLLATLWAIVVHRCRRPKLEHHQATPPPVVPGPPILGSALPLGTQGAAFLHECWLKHGDAFTVRVPGQRLTFIFAPSALVHFFRAPSTELSFLPAVEQWTQRVFGLPRSFARNHGSILHAVRQAVGVRTTLPEHAERLLPRLIAGLSTWADGSSGGGGASSSPPSSWYKLELHEAVLALVFSASVDSLFGPEFLARNGVEAMRVAFFEFEGCFEMAASPVPHIFQPKFKAVKRTLLTALRQSYEAGDFFGSVVGKLIEGCGLPPRDIPNMLLAVLWASQANIGQAAFWAIAFLLLPENAAHLEAVQESVLRASNAGEEAAEGTELQLCRLVAAACDPSSLLSRCCMEALRLRSSSTDVRIAASDVPLPLDCEEEEGSEKKGKNAAVVIPKGDMVVICPWMSHVDPRIYENPQRFDPARQGASLPGGRQLHSPAAGVGGIAGLAFGGGRFRCPGRSFAEMELGVLVGLAVAGLEIKLLERQETEEEGEETCGRASPGDSGRRLPPANLLKLVGIKQPAGPCWVRVRRR